MLSLFCGLVCVITQKSLSAGFENHTKKSHISNNLSEASNFYFKHTRQNHICLLLQHLARKLNHALES